MRKNPHVRFDERDVETDPWLNHKAPPDQRGGNRYVQPTATAPHLDFTHRFISPRRINSIAFGGKRTFSEPLLQKDL